MYDMIPDFKPLRQHSLPIISPQKYNCIGIILLSASINFFVLQPSSVDKTTLWKIVIDILTEPTPRQKLDHINSLDNVVELLRGSKNIVVLTGAGVCTVELNLPLQLLNRLYSCKYLLILIES